MQAVFQRQRDLGSSYKKLDSGRRSSKKEFFHKFRSVGRNMIFPARATSGNNIQSLYYF